MTQIEQAYWEAIQDQMKRDDQEVEMATDEEFEGSIYDLPRAFLEFEEIEGSDGKAVD